MYYNQYQASKDDGLPSKICQNCKMKINDIFIFKEKCKKSNELLKTLFNKAVLTNDTCKVDSVVVPNVETCDIHTLHDSISAENNEPKIDSSGQVRLAEPATQFNLQLDSLNFNVNEDNIDYNELNVPSEKVDTPILDETETEVIDNFIDDANEESHTEYLIEEIEEPNFSIKMEDSMSAECDSIDYVSPVDDLEQIKNDQINMITESCNDYEIEDDIMPKLECEICNIQFIDQVDYLTHVKTHESPRISKSVSKKRVRSTDIHKADAKYLCQLCGINLKGKPKFEYHTNCHIKTLPYILEKIDFMHCGTSGCGMIFSNMDLFENHLLNCSNKEFRNSDLDSKCPVLFDDEFEVDCDSKLFSCIPIENSGNLTLKCSHFSCNFEAMSVIDIMEHVTASHPVYIQENMNDIFRCSICNMWSDNHLELLIHFYMHSESFACPFDSCGEYERFFYLSTHIEKSHVITQNEVCKHCNDVFNSYDELLRHLRNTCKERHFQCLLCSKKFLSQRTLSVHEKIHANDKRHVCSYCSKKFIQSGDLKIHMRLHTGEKPYKCPLCPKRFRTTGNRQEHAETHTNEKNYEVRYRQILSNFELNIFYISVS